MYTYCNNNPINFVDPTGHSWVKALSDWGTSVGQAINSWVEPNVSDPLNQVASGDLTSIDNAIKPDYDVNVVFTGKTRSGEVVSEEERQQQTATFQKDAMDIAMGSVGGGAGKVRVVIGESMEKRVIPYAKSIGAKYYKPISQKAENWMANNKRWIREQIKKGAEIIDIGIDPERSVRSDFYAMEKQEIKKAGYQVTEP